MISVLPLVSVIIPTYKRPEKLPRAINSVINQTYSNVEIIVVDDNDPNSEGRRLTEEIMSIYDLNQRVRYIKHEKNRNGSAARNTGAKHSTAKYLSFLDDDDEYLPEKISSLVSLMEKLDDSWGCCYSLAYTKKDGEPKKPIAEKREGNMFLEALAKEFSIVAGSNLFVRKEVFDSVNGFDETFVRNQDLEFLTRILQMHKIAYCSTPGVIVYVHTEKRNVNQEDVTRQYLESFKPVIDQLPYKEQRYVKERIMLQLFFRLLRSDRNYKRCLQMVMKKEVSFIKALHYSAAKLWNRLIV